MGVMLRNAWTTIIGFLLGAATYLSTTGMKFPETKGEWGSLLVGVLMAGMGVVAKDATTGSKPPAA